ncbi:MAG: hypothetical protein U0359_41085 [Byssovorax sp.]
MTTRDPEKLPDDLVFEPDGHLSEVGLTCLADGEVTILPAAALAHAEGCDQCTARLGSVALLSLGVGEALRAEDVAAEIAAVTAIAAKQAAAVKVERRESPAPAAAKVTPIARGRRPLPRAAIVAALLVAAVGSAPAWLGLMAEWKSVVSGSTHAISVLAKMAAMTLRSAPGSFGVRAIALRWAAAALLIVIGAVMAKVMTRRQMVQGGVR